MEENKKMYVCEGTCAGEAPTTTETGEKAEAPNCAADDCNKHGEPLTEFIVCSSCSNKYKEGDEHTCNQG